MDKSKVENVLEYIKNKLKDNSTIKVTNVKGAFDSNSATLTITIVDHGEDSKEVKDFRKDAHFFGLNKNDLGRVFREAGKDYRIIGLHNGGRSKTPILCECEGKQYRFAANRVIFLLTLSSEGIKAV